MDTTIELKRRRFTLEEYHRMGEVGIFRSKERVELIEGEIASSGERSVASRAPSCLST